MQDIACFLESDKNLHTEIGLDMACVDSVWHTTWLIQSEKLVFSKPLLRILTAIGGGGDVLCNQQEVCQESNDVLCCTSGLYII